MFYPGIVMEGGAVDFNGAGTVLTTTSCLLNKNRNPGLSKERDRAIPARLLRPAARAVAERRHRGRRHRRPHRRPGAIHRPAHHRDRHRDQPARSPTTRILQMARRAIDKFRDQDGRPFEIVEMPMPRPVEHDGQRLPATYVNFYFVNGALLVPTFGQRDRDRAGPRRAAAAPPGTAGHRCRLPRPDLGTRRDSLLYPAATPVLGRPPRTELSRAASGTRFAPAIRLSDQAISAPCRSSLFPHGRCAARRRERGPAAEGRLRKLPQLAEGHPLRAALDPLRNLHPPRRQDRPGLRGSAVRARPRRRQGAPAD